MAERSPQQADVESSPPPSYLLESRYLATECVAVGETCEVFSGTDTWSGELVCVRMLRRDRPERAAMFARRCERLFGLTSSRFVRAMHYGDDRTGRPFLVTELLVGRGVEKLKKVRWEVATEVTRQCALAINEMHLHGLAHGDVRPSSFFVAASNEGGRRVKLLDLGAGDRTATPSKDRRAIAGLLHRLVTGFDAPADPSSMTLDQIPPVLAENLATWLYADEDGATLGDVANVLRELLDPQGTIGGDRPSQPFHELLVLPKISIKVG